MVSTASTNALPMNCPWRNKLSPSPRPRRGVHIVKVCPVDNIYLLCYTATCLSSIAGAGYSSPFPSHQGVHTRWFGRALEWHSRGQRFDPAYLHHHRECEENLTSLEVGFLLYAAIAEMSSPALNCSKSILKSICSRWSRYTSTRRIRQLTIIFFASMLALSYISAHEIISSY